MRAMPSRNEYHLGKVCEQVLGMRNGEEDCSRVHAVDCDVSLVVSHSHVVRLKVHHVRILKLWKLMSKSRVSNVVADRCFLKKDCCDGERS